MADAAAPGPADAAPGPPVLNQAAPDNSTGNDTTSGDNPQSRPFLEQVSQEHRDSEHLRDITDVNHMATTLIELRSKPSGGVGIPTADATAEQIREFWTAMGVPEAPGQYEISDELRDRLGADFVEFARNELFKGGMSQPAFTNVMEAWAKHQEDTRAAAKAAKDKAMQDEIARLRDSTWKGRYNEMVALAKKANQQYFGQSMHQAMEDSGLLEDPRWLEGMARIATEVGEDRINKGHIPPAPGAGAPERAYPNSPEMYDRDQNAAQRRAGRTASRPTTRVSRQDADPRQRAPQR